MSRFFIRLTTDANEDAVLDALQELAAKLGGTVHMAPTGADLDDADADYLMDPDHPDSCVYCLNGMMHPVNPRSHFLTDAPSTN